MLITGMILFGTTQLIPQMLQQVLGYSALDAGLALTFGGIATLVATPIAGRLVGKVDVRFILGAALLVQAAALYNLASLSADLSFTDAAMARLYQAMALPFLFVPLSAIAYNGLKQSDSAQASSLLNVARNLGGTIGIALAQVILARQQQQHQSELTWKLNPLEPNYQDWLARAGQVLPQVSNADGSSPALGALDREVQQQASMLAFLDVFRSLMVVVLVLAPVILFLRSSKNIKGGGAA